MSSSFLDDPEFRENSRFGSRTDLAISLFLLLAGVVLLCLPPGLVGWMFVGDRSFEPAGISRFAVIVLALGALAFPWLWAYWNRDRQLRTASALVFCLPPAAVGIWVGLIHTGWPLVVSDAAAGSTWRLLSGIDPIALLLRCELLLFGFLALALTASLPSDHPLGTRSGRYRLVVVVLGTLVLPPYIYAAAVLKSFLRDEWGRSFLWLIPVTAGTAELLAGRYPSVAAVLVVLMLFESAVSTGFVGLVANGQSGSTEMAFSEHLLELLRRTRLCVGLSLLVFVVVYLLPDDALGSLLAIEQSSISGPLARFTLTVAAALLVTCPVWLYQLWRYVSAGLYPHERVIFNRSVTALFCFVVPGWYGIVCRVWPELVSLTEPLGLAGGLLGVDAGGLVFKGAVFGLEAIVFASITILIGGDWNEILQTPELGDILGKLRIRVDRVVWTALAYVLVTLLVPAWIWAAAVLLLFCALVWYTLSRRNRFMLLAIPVATALFELRHGNIPWLTVAICSLFALQLYLLARLIESIIQKSAIVARRDPHQLAENFRRVCERASIEAEPLNRFRRRLTADVQFERQTREAIESVCRNADAATDMQVQAVQAMQHIGDGSFLDSLERFCDAEHDRPVRLAAMQGLAVIDRERAEPVLHRLLGDSDMPVSWMAEDLLNGEVIQEASVVGGGLDRPVADDPPVEFLTEFNQDPAFAGGDSDTT